MARNRQRGRKSRLVLAPVALGKGKSKFTRKPWARRNARGFLSIVRKAPVITMSNSSTAGLATISDPTSTCLSVGTPVASAGLTGLYDIPFSMTFRLDQVTQSGDITALADSYKIQGAYVRLFYNSNQSTSNTASAVQGRPYLQWIADHDDAGVPNLNNFRARMGLKFRTFKDSGYIGMSVRPKPTMEVFGPVGTSYSLPNRSPWITTADADVPHYSIKGALMNVPLPGGALTTQGQSVFTFDVALKVLAKDFQ